MRKLILCSVMLFMMSNHVFALTCPQLYQVVEGSEWMIPEGWMQYSEDNTANELTSQLEVNGTIYGELRCKYKSKNGWLEIKDTNYVNMLLSFNNNWRTVNQFHYFCVCNTNRVNSCSYDMNLLH